MSARNYWLCLLLMALPTLLPAAQPTVAVNVASDDLEEVVVQGRRELLQEMRKEIVQLEDKFYERFNEINSDNEFDFYCTDKARTGTAIRQKICRPRFVADAEGDEGRASIAAIRGETGGLTNPARMLVDIKNQRLQSLMIELIRKDPDLRSTLIRYGDLKATYTTLLTGERPTWAVPAEETP